MNRSKEQFAGRHRFAVIDAASMAHSFLVDRRAAGSWRRLGRQDSA